MTILPSTASAFLLTREQKTELDEIHNVLVTIIALASEVETGFASAVMMLLEKPSDVLDELTSYRMLPVGEQVVKKVQGCEEIPEKLRVRFAEELSKSDRAKAKEGLMPSNSGSIARISRHERPPQTGPTRFEKRSPRCPAGR